MLTTRASRARTYCCAVLLPAACALAAALLFVAGPAGAQPNRLYNVPESWPLVPSGVRPGQHFRLMFLTSTTRSAASTNIADYNTHVQNAAHNNPTLRPYKNDFRAYVSTRTVDARDNTDTRGHSGRLLLYWVNGSKVADGANDFHDGTWRSYDYTNESGASAKPHSGWTGSKFDGTKHATHYAGAAKVNVLRKQADDTHISIAEFPKGQSFRLYAVSPIFTVPRPRDPPGKPSGLTAKAGDAKVTLSWSFPNDLSIRRYQYQRKQGNNPWRAWKDIPGSSFATTSHVDTDVSNSLSFSYRIRAVNAVGTGTASVAVSATPTNVLPPPKPTITAPETVGSRGWFHIEITFDQPVRWINKEAERLTFGFNTARMVSWTEYPGGRSVVLLDPNDVNSNGATVNEVKVQVRPRVAIGLAPITRWNVESDPFFKIKVDRVAPQVSRASTVDGTNQFGALDPRAEVVFGFSEPIEPLQLSDFRCSVKWVGDPNIGPCKDSRLEKKSNREYRVHVSAASSPTVEHIRVRLDLGEVRDPYRNVAGKMNTFREVKLTPDREGPRPKLTNASNRLPTTVTGDFTLIVYGNEHARLEESFFRLINARLLQKRSFFFGSSSFLEFRFRPLYSGSVSVQVRKDQYKDQYGNGNYASNTVAMTARLSNGEPIFRDGQRFGHSVTLSVPENSPALTVVGTIPAATDPDGSRDTLEYAMSPTSRDPDAFFLDSTRQLRTLKSFDYETKNAYAVAILMHDGKAADGTYGTSIDDRLGVAINVTNVDEAGTVTLSEVPQVGEPLTAVLSDPDGDIGKVSWRWVRSYWGVHWHDIPGATTNPWTPTAATQDWFVEARATYADGQGAGKRAAGHRRAGHTGGDRVKPPRPASPAGVAAAGGDRSVGLSWRNPRNARISGYEYRHREADEATWGAWTAIGSSGAATTSHTVSGLVNGTRYAFQLRALSTSLGTGDASEAVEAAALPPDQVRGVSVTAEVERLEVSWTRVVGVRGYKVQWKSGAEAFDAARQHTLDGDGATRDTLRRLVGSRAYTVRVLAIRPDRTDGPPSEPVTATPRAPALSVDSPRVAEGDSGTAALVWTVRLRPASVHRVTVSYVDADTGTASAGDDYEAFSGALAFAPGETAKEVSVAVNGDTAPEKDETVVLRLFGAVHAAIAAAEGTGAIADDDDRPPAAPAGLTATGASGAVTLRWTGPADGAILRWQYRRDAGAWRDMPGSTAATRSFRVGGLANGVALDLAVRAVNAVGAGPAAQVAATPVTPAPAGQSVPIGWTHTPWVPHPEVPSSLIPLTSGNFRLLFVTSGTTRAASRDIRTYNRFVQAAAARNAALSGFSGKFRALVSTGTVNARDNSATTGTGVPVYWLNGAKAADNHAGLFGASGSRAGRDEAGKAVPANASFWTGTRPDGTTFYEYAAGAPTAADKRFPHTLSDTLKSGESIMGGGLFSRNDIHTERLLAISPVLTVSSVPQPPRVTNVTVTPGAGSLAVSWNRVPVAGGYRVQWKSGAESYDATRQHDVAGSATTSWTIPDLTGGVEYTVRVFATGATGAGRPDSAPSAEVKGTPRKAPPERVTNVAVTPGIGQLAVTWDAAARAGGYKVQWKSGAESYDAARQHLVGDGATTAWTLARLTPGARYTVRVVATRAGAPDGAPSAEAAGVPAALGRVLNARLAPGAGALAAAWDAVAGAGGYKVQWKSGGESYGATRQHAVGDGATTAWTITGLTPTTTYTVRVAATRQNVPDGPWSAEVSATPPALETIAPTLALEGVPERINTTGALTVTFRFSEAVTGFGSGDVTVANGSLTALAKDMAAAVADTVWTATVTPDGGGDLTVTVAAGAATDSDGNTGPAAAVAATAAWDATAPALTLAGVPPRIDSKAALKVTFRFTEAVAGFEAGDVTVTNGALTGFAKDTSAAVADTVWRATVTPDGGGDLTVRVAANTVADGHGNAGPAAAVTRTAAYRPTKPTVTTIEGMPASINSTDLITLTVTFSEPVRNFATGGHGLNIPEGFLRA